MFTRTRRSRYRLRRTAFARRVYLDLVGRIPKVAEVREFGDDKTLGKRSALVDQLLRKPSYAVHLVSVLRSAWLPETLTDVTVQYFGMQYEDWLRKQLLANAPIDTIVKRTLTANLQARNGFRQSTPETYNADEASLPAFYTAGQMKPENVGSTVTRAFLGVQTRVRPMPRSPVRPVYEAIILGDRGILRGTRPATADARYF